MNEKLLQKIKKVTPYIPGEQPKTNRIIKLNTNEHAYPPSPSVLEAYKSFDPATLRKYPDSDSNSLNQSIADHYGLEKSQVFSGNGSDEVLALAFLTYFQSDLPVLFSDITYSFYKVWCALYDIPYELVPLADDFTINAADYNRPNGGVIIANPNAPTSIGMELCHIEEIIKNNRESVVIVDEAYVDFGGVSALPLLDKYENLLVVHTFSKFRSLAGLRIGYAMGSSQLIAYLSHVKNAFNSYPLDSIQQAMATAALMDKAYYLERAAIITKTRESFAAQLAELGFQTLDSQANFVFTTHKKHPAKAIYEYLKEQNIFVRYFDADRISNHLRITIGTDEEMASLLSALKNFL